MAESISLAITSCPPITCCTNSDIMSLARSAWTSSLPSRPSSRIRLSRLVSPRASWVTTDSDLLLSIFLLIWPLLAFARRTRLFQSQRLTELFLCGGVLNNLLQQFFKLVVAIHL